MQMLVYRLGTEANSVKSLLFLYELRCFALQHHWFTVVGLETGTNADQYDFKMLHRHAQSASQGIE